MNDNKLNELLNNPSFEIDLTAVIFENYKLSMINNEYLKTILELQAEIREIAKGRVKSDYDDELISKVEKMEKIIYDCANENLTEDLNKKFIKK
tara:strand:+ start:5560 stop:5841 length:282 start_codon:yes stop_codon:yes gene_type:complete